VAGPNAYAEGFLFNSRKICRMKSQVYVDALGGLYFRVIGTCPALVSYASRADACSPFSHGCLVTRDIWNLHTFLLTNVGEETDDSITLLK
jgi:hypothetical protein